MKLTPANMIPPVWPIWVLYIADLKEKAIADLKEEIIKMNQVLEAKQGQMNAEVMALKKQSDEMEAALRKEIVEENVRLNQLIQQTNDDHSKEEVRWL